MSDPSLFRYRVTFGKDGRLAMLSHLELTHALERMIRRAQLPFAVSQGFSPHMRIGFGAALPVGVGGTREVFDLFLTDEMADEDILSALVAAAVPNLRPVAVQHISSQEPAASIAYPYSVYEAIVEFANDGAAVPSISVIPENITIERQGKTKEFHVADYLIGTPEILAGVDGEDGEGAEDAEEGEEAEGVFRLRFILQFLSTGSLRPDVFVANVLAENKINGTVRSICRIDQWATFPDLH